MSTQIAWIVIIPLLAWSSGCAAMAPPAPTPGRIADANLPLETTFGPPSQAGFGSAVFVESLERPQDLEAAALRWYRHFVGQQWNKTGEAAWMATWRRVYARDSGQGRGVVAELRAIADPAARSSVGVLLDGHDHPDAAMKALSAVYDDPAMESLQVYALGDGAALSGVLIAGRARSGTATFLLFLMD
jgi:hypothetical protein